MNELENKTEQPEGVSAATDKPADVSLTFRDRLALAVGRRTPQSVAAIVDAGAKALTEENASLKAQVTELTAKVTDLEAKADALQAEMDEGIEYVKTLSIAKPDAQNKDASAVEPKTAAQSKVAEAIGTGLAAAVQRIGLPADALNASAPAPSTKSEPVARTEEDERKERFAAVRAMWASSGVSSLN